MHTEMALLKQGGASESEIAEQLHLTAAQLVAEWANLTTGHKCVTREEGVNLIIAQLVVEARRALADKHDELALIIKSPEDRAILTFNLMGIIVGVSRYSEKLLGIPASRLIGMPVDVLLTQRIEGSATSGSEMARAEEGDFVEARRTHKKPDGTTFEADHSLVAIFGKMGEVTGFVREIHDLTKCHVQEIEIEDLNASLALLIKK